MELSELATKVGGHLEHYSAAVDIKGVAPIEDAKNGHIAHVGNPAERAAAKRSGASAVITAPGCDELALPRLCGLDPYLLFARVVEIFKSPKRYDEGIHPTAVIHKSAKIGPRASIAAYVVIDRDVEIDADAVLLPHVVIYRGARIGKNFFAHAHAVVREDCLLGDNVILQNGAVIGSDGFGFVRESKDQTCEWKKVLHCGSVILGDQVEVQANACIDRSDDGDTRIGSGVKIGDLVHIAHKVNVNESTLILPQAALAGRVKVGKNVLISGQAGVAGNCEIADGAIVLAHSGVIGRVGAGKVVCGYPAIEHKSFLRSFAMFKRLPELAKKLQQTREHGKSSDLISELHAEVPAI